MTSTEPTSHHRLVDVVSAGLGVLASKPVACMICPL